VPDKRVAADAVDMTDGIVYRDDVRLFLPSHAEPHLDPEEK
jgi:hypothetical protein